MLDVVTKTLPEQYDYRHTDQLRSLKFLVEYNCSPIYL